MILLGIDFDNTLVRYDRLFHKLASEKGLIKKSAPKNKIAIRDYLRNKGNDDKFTMLQGEVYGARIVEAEPAEGALTTLTRIRKHGVRIVIVSHKTKYPYAGPSYDLREAARAWLLKHGLAGEHGPVEHVYFEDTKEEKAARIAELGCTHYIDDLPEVLSMLEEKTRKILYDPDWQHKGKHTFDTIGHWKDLGTIIHWHERA